MLTRAVVLMSLMLMACEGKVAYDAPFALEEESPSGPGVPIGTPGPPEEMLPEFSPGPAQMRRLTTAEYGASIRALVGQDVVLPEIEQDTPINGLSAIGSTNITLSPRGTELFEDAARQIAATVMRDPARRGRVVDCSPSGPDGANACAREFVTKFGRRAWRRPLTEAQITRYVDVATFASDKLGDFWSGLEFAMVGLLQSPYFIYRTEYGEPDPDHPGRRKLTQLELATRMSFLLWGATPDETLLRAAERGELSTPAQLRAQAERMLYAPEARPALRTFWAEHLEIKDLGKLGKDAMLYPQMTPELGAAMEEETYRLMEYLVFEARADMRDMFTSTTTFVDRRLATLYGLSQADTLQDGVFERVDIPTATRRVGVLGHASFLAKHAHPDSTSPTHRGLFVRQGLLCQTMPPPPANVDTTLPELDPNSGIKTMRQRLESYSDSPACGGCHGLMDPIGFAFEDFDAIGQRRTLDNGEPVETNGTLDGQMYEDSVGLAHVLRGRTETMDCLVRKLYRHATGRVEGDGEQRAIRDLSLKFADADYRFDALLLELVVSPGFLYLQPEQ